MHRRGNMSERDHLGDIAMNWENNIKMFLQQIVWEGVDWIALSQDKDKQQFVVSTGINLHVPYDVWNFLTS